MQRSPKRSIASQSKDQAPGIGLLLLKGRPSPERQLLQQLWEDGERFLLRAPGEGQFLSLVAGSGGLALWRRYGDGSGDVQPGSSTFAHVKHV